jgi:hypothetical protein
VRPSMQSSTASTSTPSPWPLAPAPFSVADDESTTPADVPAASILDGGFRLLPSLDVEVKLEMSARIHRGYLGRVGVISPAHGGVEIVADPDESFDEVMANLRRRYQMYSIDGFIENERQADGWRVVYTMHVTDDPEQRMTGVHMRRKVGRMTVDCSSWSAHRGLPDRVRAVCSSLRPVPGGAAEQPLPSTPPRFEYHVSGGMEGASAGGFRIWDDGTVHYHGPRCVQWRGHIGHISPARVAELVDDFAKAGFQEMPTIFPSFVTDSLGVAVTLRTGETKKVSVYSTSWASASPSPPVLEPLATALASAVGHNPCQ